MEVGYKKRPLKIACNRTKKISEKIWMKVNQLFVDN